MSLGANRPHDPNGPTSTFVLPTAAGSAVLSEAAAAGSSSQSQSTSQQQQQQNHGVGFGALGTSTASLSFGAVNTQYLPVADMSAAVPQPMQMQTSMPPADFLWNDLGTCLLSSDPNGTTIDTVCARSCGYLHSHVRVGACPALPAK